MEFVIDLRKWYPVDWETEPYQDDEDMFLDGQITINEDIILDITLGVTNCVFDPALKEHSFVKFRIYDQDGDLNKNLLFIPIEWFDDKKGSEQGWWIDNYEFQITTTNNSNIYKVKEVE